MGRQDAVALERMDGPAAAAAEGALRAVYAEVFAEPPYAETERDVAAAFDRFRAQTREHGFRAVLARAEDGTPVGFAFGFPLAADTPWWDELTGPVAEELRREDGRRTFGLLELAVRRTRRGQGIARRLHTALVEGLETERVLLNVSPHAEAARAAYRSWGYRTIGEARPGGPGTAVYEVMLRTLR
ncbi:GNAT family N-acetyltransferase [Streptomyces sp. NPDC097619]|uniref:GNAT family N-acetyltransferase n=1 Tax=Streptomyces sp. NPDC097619 TaxID=3157228 RepID=UPI0033200979